MSEIRSGRSARAELGLAARWDFVFRLVRLVSSASPESLILMRLEHGILFVGQWGWIVDPDAIKGRSCTKFKVCDTRCVFCGRVENPNIKSIFQCW